MTNEILDRAFQAHKVGDLAAAAQGYEAVLQSTPGHSLSLALLALIRQQAVFSRMSKRLGLANLKGQGFMPGTVFDVGAQTGTPELFEIFPDAHHVMLEPVAECEPVLRALCSQLRSAEYHMAAVTERSGQVTLTVSASRQYASVVRSSTADGAEYRTIPSVSLNDLCSRRLYPGPYLIKIDVDGTEIDVLKGASALASPDSVFVIEATLNDGDPRFPKILDFFRPYDFVLHDIVDPMFRPADGALWQVDVIMVHGASRYRQMKQYQ